MVVVIGASLRHVLVHNVLQLHFANLNYANGGLRHRTQQHLNITDWFVRIVECKYNNKTNFGTTDEHEIVISELRTITTHFLPQLLVGGHPDGVQIMGIV